MSERARNISSIAFIAVMAVALILITSTRPATVDRVEQIDAHQVPGMPGRVNCQLPLTDGGRHDGSRIRARLRRCARRGDSG